MISLARILGGQCPPISESGGASAPPAPPVPPPMWSLGCIFRATYFLCKFATAGQPFLGLSLRRLTRLISSTSYPGGATSVVPEGGRADSEPLATFQRPRGTLCT